MIQRLDGAGKGLQSCCDEYLYFLLERVRNSTNEKEENLNTDRYEIGGNQSLIVEKRIDTINDDSIAV